MRILPPDHPMHHYFGAKIVMPLDRKFMPRNIYHGRQCSPKTTVQWTPKNCCEHIPCWPIQKALIATGKPQNDLMEGVRSGRNCYKQINEFCENNKNNETMTYCRVNVSNLMFWLFTFVNMADEWDTDDLRKYLASGKRMDICDIPSLIQLAYEARPFARPEALVGVGHQLKWLLCLGDVFWANNEYYNHQDAPAPTEENLQEHPIQWHFKMRGDTSFQDSDGSFLFKDCDDPNAPDVDQNDKNIEWTMMGPHKYVLYVYYMYIMCIICVYYMCVLYVLVLFVCIICVYCMCCLDY